MLKYEAIVKGEFLLFGQFVKSFQNASSYREEVDQYFSFLVDEYGYEHIRSNHFGGREQNYEYQKGKLILRISVAPGVFGRSSLPYVSLQDRRNQRRRDFSKIVSVENLLREIWRGNDRQRYPFHDKIYSTCWPVSWYQRSKYKKELDQEFYEALSEKAHFVKDHYVDIEEGRITQAPRDFVEIKNNLDQTARHSIWTTMLIFLFPVTLYLFFPQSNYWIWSLIVPGLAIWLTIINWKEVFDFDERPMTKYDIKTIE